MQETALINFLLTIILGLRPRVFEEAAQSGVETLGAGAGSARLISGSQSIIHELEASLAAFKQAEGALCFSSGYAAALGAVPALVGQGDVVIVDKLVHASLVDAARLSGAKLRVFKHNDLADLEGFSMGKREKREYAGHYGKRIFHGWRSGAGA